MEVEKLIRESGGVVIFIVVLIVTYILAGISRKMNEGAKKIHSLYFMFFAVLIIIVVAALRSNIGDTYVYVNVYNKFSSVDKLSWEYLRGGKDWGYTVLTYILYQISSNPQFMIFTTALITQVLYFIFFNIHKSYIELEIFIYIASGYYVVTMNGIRQSLAAGIILLGTKFIKENKVYEYMLLILVASTIHESALIMIPIYFICKMNPWSKKTIGIIIIAGIGCMFFNELMPYLFKLLQGSQYSVYEEIFMDGSEGGANILRLVVAIVPIILAYKNRNELKKWEYSNIFINISIINFIFMLFSVRIWIFARFSMYFSLYNCVLLPYTISRWSNEKEKKILYCFLLIAYFIFFMKEYKWIDYNSKFNILSLF